MRGMGDGAEPKRRGWRCDSEENPGRACARAIRKRTTHAERAASPSSFFLLSFFKAAVLNFKPSSRIFLQVRGAGFGCGVERDG